MHNQLLSMVVKIKLIILYTEVLSKEVINIQKLYEGQILSSNNSGEFKILKVYKDTADIQFIETGNIKNFSINCILHGAVKDPDNYKSKVSDAIFQSMYYGKYRIIRDLGNKLSAHGDRYVEIEFLLTRNRVKYRYDHVLSGAVKDPAFTNPYRARDIIGPTPMVNPRIQLYQTWSTLVARCTNPNSSGYHKYGAIGITICNRWLDFNNFLYDAVLLPGWILKFNDPVVYQLDKDTLQYNIPKNERVYSPATCIWVAMQNNIQVAQCSEPQVIVTDNIYELNGLYYIITYYKNYGPFDNYNAAVSMMNYINQTNIDAPYMHPTEVIKHNLDARELCKIV